jgi:hypothetical protein
VWKWSSLGAFALSRQPFRLATVQGMTMKKSHEEVTAIQKLAALLVAQAEDDLEEQDNRSEQPKK